MYHYISVKSCIKEWKDMGEKQNGSDEVEGRYFDGDEVESIGDIISVGVKICIEYIQA